MQQQLVRAITHLFPINLIAQEGQNTQAKFPLPHQKPPASL